MYETIGRLETPWAGVTTVHPVGLAAFLVCIAISLYVSRDRVAIPFFVFLIIVPTAQRLVVVSLDFSFIRIFIYILIVRALYRREWFGISPAQPDATLALWGVWSIVAQGFLVGDMAASLSRVGYVSEAVGAYFIGRIYLRNIGSHYNLLNIIGILTILASFIILIEASTGRNMFAVFGGAPEITKIREGKLRCQGSFAHPILLGVYWALLVPWFLLKVRSRLSPFSNLLFIFAATIIVITSASSTPIMALLLGTSGVLLFGYRRHLKIAKYLVLFGLVAFSIISNKPVWHLVSRIDIVGGSTGWHRYYLIDRAIAHFNEWWLVGTLNTADWGEGLDDVTNQFLLEGVRSGFLGMLLFIILIYHVYCLVRKKIASTLDDSCQFYWVCGVVLITNIMVFFTVSYFGQNFPAFFVFLGSVVTLSRASNSTQGSLVNRTI